MRYAVLIAVGVGALVGCKSEPESSLAISIVRALEPDANCEFKLDNETWSQGWYDPKRADAMQVSLEVAGTVSK